jgi:predicted membrane-bound spermidine synthase
MSTTTETKKIQADEAKNAHSLQGWFIILLVFVAGAASLAVELSASRLLAPYFGTSLFVWASLIGLILLYLTVGYYVGGILSDRHPQSAILYTITALAAVFIAIIPFIARPVLSWSLATFVNDTLGIFYGSLVAIILLFTIPTILLGCVSPFAIRLRIDQVGSSGRVSGMLYAISTAGSIVGTFLPVLVLLPDIGVQATFLSAAGLLLLVSLAGLALARRGTIQTQMATV